MSNQEINDFIEIVYINNKNEAETLDPNVVLFPKLKEKSEKAPA